jgi:AmmeMemoRadiSam system protein A
MCRSRENDLAALRSDAAKVCEFSSEERQLLLRLAHHAIASAFQGGEVQATPPSAHLAEARGVFTTLYYRGELRGCVGYVLPVAPLFLAVAQSARAAAFEDRRFSPVRVEELSGLRVSLSVLSPLQPIQPDQIELGVHGLVISRDGRRGLLLPQVPLEHGWDRVTFLEQTCRKAGLPLDSWQSGAALEAFTAEVFGDEAEGGKVP